MFATVNIENLQWARGEDFREFVIKGSCENVKLCGFGCLCSVRMQCLLILRLQKHLSRKCAISRQGSKLSPFRFLNIELKITRFYNFPY